MLECLFEWVGEEGVDICDVILLLFVFGYVVFSVCDVCLDCWLDFDLVSGWVLLLMLVLDFLLNLYKSLFVGFFGWVLVSLFGVLLLLLCLVGVLLYSCCWCDLWCWWWDCGLCLVLFDLYGLIGIWGLFWLLLFGFIGVFSGLGVFGILLLVLVVYL